MIFGSIIDKLEFAMQYHVDVEIHSKNGKTFWADIYNIIDHQITWDFANKTENEIELKPMNIDNICGLAFHPVDNQNFSKYLRCKNSDLGDYEVEEKRIKTLFDYYSQILHAEKEDIKAKEVNTKKEDEDKRIAINTLDGKIKLLDTIAKKILESKDDLLLPFIENSTFCNDIINTTDRPILLLSNSNLSQKTAVEKTLSQKVSFIEGPPGTGKTTTILSIIANLLYRGKSFVVVSKNNSAIDNIAEELDKLDLPKIYIRLGNSKYTTNLFKYILNDIEGYQRQIENYGDIPVPDIAKLNISYDEIKSKEQQFNELVQKKNTLFELKNQKRHIEKRQNAYGEKFTGHFPFWLKFVKLDQLCKIIDRISGKIEKYNENLAKRVSLSDKMIALLLWHINSKDYFKQYLLLKWSLESMYITKQIIQTENCIDSLDFDKLKKEIENYYKSYVDTSMVLLKAALFQHYRKDKDAYKCLINEVSSFKKKYKKEIEKNSFDSEFLKEKSRIIELLTDFFPFALTTADSLAGNFYKHRFGDKKFDYVIMDEATQCDLISGISALFYAKNCVISGDSKQLSAITGENIHDIDESNIRENLKYFNNDFLNATKASFHVIPTLLKEHYRCDYNIINFCNQFFYDNALIIYKDATPNAMELLNVDKGKYVNDCDFSFSNDREIYSIKELCGNDLSDACVITPFRDQKELLKKKFPNYEKSCGTIHSFQGQGKDRVYFSTVLNDLSICNRHLAGNHNLFTPELVNVAVSRAKNKFTLVTDKEYFLARSRLIKNLILYIDKYGKEIPDKTVCLFDNLYKQMPTYVEVDNCSNPFELAVFKVLKKFCNMHNSYTVFAKLPLAELVTDAHYLNTHWEIRNFVLSERAHVDFVIENILGNPALAIEVDGKDHDTKEQRARDAKKNEALKHMNIPLKRIKSKDAFSENDLIHLVENEIFKLKTEP